MLKSSMLSDGLVLSVVRVRVRVRHVSVQWCLVCHLMLHLYLLRTIEQQLLKKCLLCKVTFYLSEHWLHTGKAVDRILMK